jgi:hypothetical protein
MEYYVYNGLTIYSNPNARNMVQILFASLCELTFLKNV